MLEQRLLDMSLFYASWQSDAALVRELLVEGANPDARNKDGLTPIMCVSSPDGEADRDICSALVEAGADLSAVDNDGDSVLHDACFGFESDEECQNLRVLIGWGAPVNHANNDGKTALFVATEGGHSAFATRAIEILLEEGASVSHRSNDGSTSLLYPADWGYIGVAKVLVGAGVDLDAQDEHGWTALMVACHSGRTDVAELLIEAGADLALSNDLGATALMCAADHGSAFLVERLLEAGADPEQRDTNEERALEQAMPYDGNLASILIEQHRDMQWFSAEGEVRREHARNAAGEPTLTLTFCDDEGTADITKCDRFVEVLGLLAAKD